MGFNDGAMSAPFPSPPMVPPGTRQLLLAVAPAWDATGGELYRLAREDGGWRAAGEALPVTFGRNGLAPSGAVAVCGVPPKAEGDGRSPTGIHPLTLAFGSAPAPPRGCRMHYRRATPRCFWVDDPASPLYNRWVTLPEGEDPPWASAEPMLRADGRYEWGVVVGYNTDPVVPGRGSAIFLHRWEAPGKPTAGCTAMAPEALLEIMRWLEPEARPALALRVE